MRNDDKRFEEAEVKEVEAVEAVEAVEIEAVIEASEDNEVKEMSAIQKVIGLFVAPSVTFASLKKKSDLVIPLILGLIMPVLYYLIFWESHVITTTQMMEAQLSAYSDQLSPAMLKMQVDASIISIPIFVVVFFFVGLFISALFIWVAGRIVKSDITYGKAFALSAYVSLVGLVSWLIMFIMTAVTGSYSIEEPMTSLISILPDAMEGTLFYYALAPIDIIAIWGYILTVIGLEIMGGFSKKAAIITVAVQFGIVLLIQIGNGLLALAFT